MSKIEYKIEMPLFTEEATGIWKDMPNILTAVVAKKQDAINKFNRLDTLVNGGELRVIGKAFGKDIYARFDASDSDMAEYESKRLASLMGSFISTAKSEEITIGGMTYTVLLKEEL